MAKSRSKQRAAKFWANIYLLQQARDITRAFRVRTMAEKNIWQRRTNHFSFPKRNDAEIEWLKTNLIYLNFTRHLTLRERKSTGIDWATKSAPREKSIKPANKKSNRPRKSFQFTEKSFKLNEKFRNLPTDDI